MMATYIYKNKTNDIVTSKATSVSKGLNFNSTFQVPQQKWKPLNSFINLHLSFECIFMFMRPEYWSK
jgi:glutaminase